MQHQGDASAIWGQQVNHIHLPRKGLDQNGVSHLDALRAVEVSMWAGELQLYLVVFPFHGVEVKGHRLAIDSEAEVVGNVCGRFFGIQLDVVRLTIQGLLEVIVEEVEPQLQICLRRWKFHFTYAHLEVVKAGRSLPSEERNKQQYGVKSGHG